MRAYDRKSKLDREADAFLRAHPKQPKPRKPRNVEREKVQRRARKEAKEINHCFEQQAAEIARTRFGLSDRELDELKEHPIGRVIYAELRSIVAANVRMAFAGREIIDDMLPRYGEIDVVVVGIGEGELGRSI
jgi:hypothetical protein